MGTYSFLDTNAAIVGPGVAASIGAGSGAAEEGISYSRVDEQNTVVNGADGTIMHSLHGSKAGTVTVRLLKTSPTNALLMAAFNLQSQNGQNWGQNTVTGANVTSGDVFTLQQAAFMKMPDNAYAKDANILEWVFAGSLDVSLGGGI